MSKYPYIPSHEEVSRMRHETGAGFYSSKDALIRARGNWTDAKRIIQYAGTVKIDAVLRDIDTKHQEAQLKESLSQPRDTETIVSGER